MSSARFIVGDVREVLATLPDASVDLVLTSPPFLALRSYLPPDHPDKAREMGSEATPGEFIDTLLDVVEECRRALAPHGSLCFELGDTYSGSGGAGGDYTDTGLRAGQEKFAGSAIQHRRSAQRNRSSLRRDRAPVAQPRDRTRLPGAEWPEEKSLCLVPEIFRFALAYGQNPLTGRSTPRWRVRNVVRWVRPNPPVGALADKFRPATSEMVVACVSRSRYFDLDAVRTPLTEPGAVKRHSTEKRNPSLGWSGNNAEIRQNEAGAPPLDWWEISTEPYPGSHYATWPAALCRRPIEAMCPTRVCTVCGEPSRRITEVTGLVDRQGRQHEPHVWPSAMPNGQGAHTAKRDGGCTTTTTTGWTECSCPGGDARWRRGVVLDPFAGSGTTLAVAIGHGRDAVGIDLDARNADLARGRVGMFLEVEGGDDLRPSQPAVDVATGDASRSPASSTWTSPRGRSCTPTTSSWPSSASSRRRSDKGV